MAITELQIRWFRLRRSGLERPFATPEIAAATLAGIQAQILPAAGLALWNRTAGLSHDDFDARLHQNRTLVKLWGQRGTLHLYPSQEWPLIYAALNTQKPSWWERQTEAQSGNIELYRATVDQVAEILKERGYLSRSDLRTLDLPLADFHFSAWGGIFADLVRRGVACHAGQAGNEGRFAYRELWLPDLHWDPPAHNLANQELVRRYFKAYGPATLRDFAYWRGVPLTSARPWIAALGSELTEIATESGPQLLLRDDIDELAAPPPERESWPVRMLYRFDPLFLAHKDKKWVIDAAWYDQIWRPAGHIEGAVLEYGRIIGTWRYDRLDKGLSVQITPFTPFPDYVQSALETATAGIARFFDLPLLQP